MEIINTESTEISITLKELTDMIDVRHNDAIKKVEKLAEEPSFGLLRKTRISHVKGKEIDTFLLDKKQAIAAAARLNNTMLMKVVDALDTMEKKNLQAASQNQGAYMGLQIQRIDALCDAVKGTYEAMLIYDKRISIIEETKRLEAWQERSLMDAKNQKVYEIAGDDKDLANKLHRKIWQLFKKKFHLPRYSELAAVKYEEGLAYLRSLTFADMV